MDLAHGNLLANLPFDTREEVFSPLLERPGLKIERIVSNGQASPPGFWYDSPQAEWVVLLAGSAAIRVDGDDEVHVMLPGAWLYLPAHCRHRVEWTDPQQPTVWLAVHHGPQP